MLLSSLCQNFIQLVWILLMLNDMTFRRATDLLSVSLDEMAQVLGRSYRSVVAYRLQKRRVPDDIRMKLASFLGERSRELEEAARELEGEE